MATFGGYETVHEIYRHGLGSVSRAKVANPTEGSNGEPNYVVKAFQPPYRIAGQDAIKPAVRSFLDRARTQQDVVTAGAKHWAPIYEAGAARDGAYYVTAYYSRTALKLISGRVKLNSQSLYVIIKSVLTGLAELKQHSGQPHGNLKPTNVLVAGEGEIDEGKIFLTDPASREQLPAADGEGADLASVGELLYQLVLHRPFRGSQSYPIMDSPEWGRLGKKADAWRQFCNQLLNPSGPSLRIESALKQLENFREKKRVVSGKVVRAVAMVAGLAIAIFAGWKYVQFRSEWKQLCLKYDDWYYRLDNQLRADPARLARLKSDPYLESALADLQAGGVELDPKKIAGNELLVMSSLADRPPLSISAVGQTHAALGRLNRFEIRINQWPVLGELSEREKVYEQRKWTAAANYLKQIIDAINPESHGDLANQLDRLATNETKLRRDLAYVEDRWQVITATQKTIQAKAPNDRVLAAFDPFVEHYVQSALSGPAPAELDEVRVAVVPVADLAGKLNEVLQSEWTDKIDRDRFAKEGEIYQKPLESLGAPDFTAWLGEVQDFYQYKLDAGSEPISQLAKMVDQTKADLEGLKAAVPNEPAETLNQYAQKIAAASTSIGQLEARQWVQKDRRTDVISRAANDVQVTLKNLRNDISLEQSKHTIDQTKWWENYSKGIADSSAVNSAWADWRTRLGVDPAKLPLSPSDFLDVRTRVEQWTNALRNVEKEFPPTPSQMGPFDALVKSKREEKLSSAIAAAAPAGAQPNLDVLKHEASKAGAQYAAWCADLSGVLSEAGATQKLLDNGYTPADPQWADVAKFKDKWSSKGIWRDVSTQPPVSTVSARIDGLSQIPQLSRTVLATRAAGPETLSLDYLRAAWQTLGKATSPSWPATPNELSLELAIRHNLGAGIESLPDAFRKQTLREELVRQGPVRLVSYLNTAATTPTTSAQFDASIRAAEAAMEPLGITGASGFDRYRRLASLEGVAPLARANVLLCGLRVASASNSLNQDQLTAINDAFKQDSSRLPAETRSRVSGIIDGFAKLSGPDTAAGPPAPKWQMRKLDDLGRRIQFATPGGTEPLEFVLIEVPGKLPTYLCTTELSLGTFLAAVPNTDWAQSGAGLLVEFSPGRDPRPGPRVWEWNDQGLGPIRLSEYWLRPRTDIVWDYFGERDPNYKFNHSKLPGRLGVDPMNHPKLPMQYLPAHTAMYIASLLGCRLPTSEEWAAAWKVNGDAATGKRNLRGQTWQQQQNYVLANRGLPEWPDAGAFTPRGFTGKTGASATSYRDLKNDLLWFREVDSEDGQLFHNLIGNVWEYLWEDPAGVDSMSDKSLRAWKTLLDSHPSQLFVIGGSAISAPEIRANVPQPVDLTHSNASPVDGLIGFADVGMRLAFNARPKTPSERLKWVLASQSYIGATDAPATRPAK
jgi:hypothetical protein